MSTSTAAAATAAAGAPTAWRKSADAAVVSLDFGTSGSGFAFATGDNWSAIQTQQSTFGGNQSVSVKQPTALLLRAHDLSFVAFGADAYNRFCGTCHGTEGESRGMFPDLRYSAALNSAEVFNSIVVDGALTANGMVSFERALTQEQVDSIRAYVVSLAIEAQRSPPEPRG